MKTFSTIFPIMLLFTNRFICSMDMHKKAMCLQQQEPHAVCTYMSTSPTYKTESQLNTHLNHKTRRTITKKIRDASNLENITDKRTALTTLQTKLLCLKKIAPEQNQQWLDQQLQEIEQHINACHYSEPKIESTDLESMSQTVLLEKEFLTRTQKIAQEEAQLNQVKLEAEQYKRAYKERLLQKQELLTQDTYAVQQKEQELRAALLKIQQELTTTEQQKEGFQQLLDGIQLRITTIENYIPQSTEQTQTGSVSEPRCTEPTDDLQIELTPTEFPLLCTNQTNSTKNSLSHSCNLQ